MHNHPSGTSVNKPQLPIRVGVIQFSPDMSEHRKDNESIPPEGWILKHSVEQLVAPYAGEGVRLSTEAPPSIHWVDK